VAEPIRMKEWLDELGRIAHAGAREGFAKRDLCTHLGLCERTAGERLRLWFRLGLIELAGRREASATDGRLAMIPVYRLLRQAKKGNRIRGRGR
jgi:hypothetical protein